MTSLQELQASNYSNYRHARLVLQIATQATGPSNDNNNLGTYGVRFHDNLQLALDLGACVAHNYFSPLQAVHALVRSNTCARVPGRQ